MIAPEHPTPLRPMKVLELPEDARIAFRAMQRAARKLCLENRRLGLPLIVWKDDKVVEERA